MDRLPLPEGFSRLYSRLLKIDVSRYLRTKKTWAAGRLSHKELFQLLAIASALSVSDHPEDRQTAYQIATRSLALSRTRLDMWVGAAELILARLGNFPGRTLLNQRFREQFSSGQTLAAPLALEVESRSLENTLTSPSGRKLTLTNFQYDLMQRVRSNAAVSFSAPTSAGKSFVLVLEVARRFRESPSGSIIYLVPTRALIRQVMRDVVQALNEAELWDIPVLCTPDISAVQDQPAAVYVLTQERLLNLLYSASAKKFPPLRLLVVDEAQEIGNSDRGILLHSAIERALNQFPKTEILFASPLTSNPDYFLRLFGRVSRGTAYVETESPVSQNVILVYPADQHPKQVYVDLVVPGAPRIEVATVTLDFVSTRGSRHYKLARLAHHFTGLSEAAILYASGPSMAEETASELCKLLPSRRGLSKAIKDFIGFLRDHIHPKYSLARMLKFGVAFHYGDMPHVVRSRVEELFAEGELQFICCTSTLLQGINLPAQHIFMLNPKKGSRSMSSSDFWNLAGRAGRMTREFQGNVWCLLPQEWEVPLFEGERLASVVSAFNDVLDNSPDAVVAAIKGQKGEGDDKGKLGHAFGKIFSEFTLAGQPLAASDYCNDRNRQILIAIDELCETLKDRVSLPRSVFEANAAIDPVQLQELADRFNGEKELTRFILPHPFERDAKTRLESVLELVEEIFRRAGTREYVYFRYLALRWMRGHSFSELLIDKLKYEERADNDEVAVSEAVRELQGDIESVLRFEYVKYLRAYRDVLVAVARARGMEEFEARIPSLHLYLEFGASSAALLNLMAIGLSRTSAILVKRALGIFDAATREECQRNLDGVEASSLPVPEVCRAEVRQVQRRKLRS